MRKKSLRRRLQLPSQLLEELGRKMQTCTMKGSGTRTRKVSAPTGGARSRLPSLGNEPGGSIHLFVQVASRFTLWPSPTKLGPEPGGSWPSLEVAFDCSLRTEHKLSALETEPA
eukprot:6467353-Amphidinium_carterae.1